jgi:hypothetical protein
LRLAALERHRAGRAASTATLLRRSAVRKARIVEDFREIIEITGGTRSAHPSSIIGYDRPTVCRVAARLHMHPDTMGRIVRAAIKAEATA